MHNLKLKSKRVFTYLALNNNWPCMVCVCLFFLSWSLRLGMFFIGVLHTHPLSYQASSPVKGYYEKLGFVLAGH